MPDARQGRRSSCARVEPQSSFMCRAVLRHSLSGLARWRNRGPRASSPVRFARGGRCGSQLPESGRLEGHVTGECNGRQDAATTKREEATDEVDQGKAPGQAAKEAAEARTWRLAPG